jgi:hypothetical protein
MVAGIEVVRSAFAVASGSLWGGTPAACQILMSCCCSSRITRQAAILVAGGLSATNTSYLPNRRIATLSRCRR